MGLFNKNNNQGLSRRERKERDKIIEKAMEEKRRRRGDCTDIDPEDWQAFEEGWRPDNW